MDEKTLQDLERAKRLFVDRNFDPELTKLMGKILMNNQPIRDGKMKFHGEVPGINSNRWYLGMKWDL